MLHAYVKRPYPLQALRSIKDKEDYEEELNESVLKLREHVVGLSKLRGRVETLAVKDLGIADNSRDELTLVPEKINSGLPKRQRMAAADVMQVRSEGKYPTAPRGRQPLPFPPRSLGLRPTFFFSFLFFMVA